MRPAPLAFLATALLASAPSDSSARTLDRRAAVRLALQQNPRVAASRAEELVLKAQGRQVDAARWPMLTLDAGVGPSFRATLVPGTAAQSVEAQYRDLQLSSLSAVFLGSITAIQPLYTFGKISLRKEAAVQGLRAREAQTRMTQADVAFEVASIYEGYLYARDVDRFLGETIHWIDSTLQSAQDKLAHDVANVTERDVLRFQIAEQLARMARERAQAGLMQARAGLGAYLGLPEGEALVVAEPELTAVPRIALALPAVVDLAEKQRPELQALRAGGDALGALASAEAAGWKPDVFVMAFLSAAYTPGRDWLQSRFLIDPLNHITPGAIVGLRWQFQGDMAGARAEEQRARAQVLQHLGAWARQGIPAEVRRAYEDVVRADKNIDQGNAGVSKAKKWMVQAAADYAVGLLDVREVSDAVEAYVTLRGAVLQARFDHNVAMAALSRATGTLDGDSELFYLAPPDERNVQP